MNRYVVFFTKGNKELASFLTDRAHELGYEGISYDPTESVTIDRISGRVTWTQFENPISPNHELGCFEKFLTTDFYKFDRKPKIYIGEYEVEFEEDGIRVGCQFVDKEIILKIAKEFEPNED